MYFLHGFFNIQSYGILTTSLAVGYTKWMVEKSDIVIANSYFTAMINQRIWNIHVDGISHLGVDSTYLQNVIKNKQIVNCQNRNILFVGRLAISKKVDKIIKAISLLNDNNKIKFIVVGDGPEKEKLIKLANKLKINTTFMGRVSHEEIYQLYRNSEIYISLSESESFGISLVEALLGGCKIICPMTGGQVEFLSKYVDRVRFVNTFNIANISSGINELLNKEVNKLGTDIANQFSYKLVAQRILDIIALRKNKNE